MATKFTASGTLFVNSSGTSVIYKAPDFSNPSGCSIVLSSLVSNKNLENIRVTESIKNGSTLISIPIDNIVVASGSSLETVPNKLVLLSGQTLESTFTASGSLSTTVSVLEIY